MKRICVFFILLTGFLCACGNRGGNTETSVSPSGRIEPLGPADSATEAGIDSLVARMSLREKIAQLMMIRIDTRLGDSQKAQEEKLVKTYKVGGIILMGDDLDESRRRIGALQACAGIPLLVAIDAEWGAAMRFPALKAWPKAAALARSESADSVRRVSRSIGEELRCLDIHINFAPVADINNNPGNIVIGERSFGGNRDSVALFAQAYMDGLRESGIISCAKHFPGHGDTSVDSHKALPKLEFPRSRLDSFELYPFVTLMDRGVPMVMTGHLAVPAIDTTLAPASSSRAITTGLLRDSLGFKGVIVSDGLEMKGLLDYYGGNPVRANLAVYKAGTDMLLLPMRAPETISAIEKCILSGEMSESDLDARVRRILKLKHLAIR